MAVAAVVTAACGPLDRSGARPLVTDGTQLGATRADVKTWHLAHDWCVGRTWASSDEYVTCAPRAYEGQASDRLRSYFRFDGGRQTASAVYAPVPCTRKDCRRPMGVDTALEGPPFVAFDAGLVARPTSAGRDDALAIELPADQRRLLDALALELERRYGPPDWTSPTGTARVWYEGGERIGLFLSRDGLWTVETHEASGYGDGA